MSWTLLVNLELQFSKKKSGWVERAQSSQIQCCFSFVKAEPHSSVGSIADLRTGGRWFDPRLSQYSFQGCMYDSHCNRINFSLTTVCCFDNGYVGKHPVAWKEYCMEYWLTELMKAWIGALAAVV